MRELTEALRVVANASNYYASRNNIDALIDSIAGYSINAQSAIDLQDKVQGQYEVIGKTSTTEISIYWNAGLGAYVGTTDEPAAYDVTFYNYDHFVIADYLGEGDVEVVRDLESPEAYPEYIQVGLAAGESGYIVIRIVQALAPQ
jgi:hypothetical protein